MVCIFWVELVWAGVAQLGKQVNRIFHQSQGCLFIEEVSIEIFRRSFFDPLEFFSSSSYHILASYIMLSTEQQQKAITALLKRAENALCADCNAKSPCWASLDFGVFVCMNCSGAHRALGPSVTRVKSTKLDTWNRDWLQNMQVGNSVLNEYWQHQLTGLNRTEKPNVNTPLNEIIKFVNNKYVKRKYAKPDEPVDPLKKQKTTELPKPKQQPIKEPFTPPPALNNSKSAKHGDLLSFTQNAILTKKQPIPGNSNLISFQAQVTTQKQNNLIAFEQLPPAPIKQSGPQLPQQHFPVQQPKAHENSQNITFDGLVNNFSSKPTAHSNHFFPANNLNYYPESHYLTQNHFSVQHSLHAMHLNGHSLSTSSRNIHTEAGNMIPKEGAWKGENAGSKITLDANLDWTAETKKKQQVVNESWTDAWK